MGTLGALGFAAKATAEVYTVTYAGTVTDTTQFPTGDLLPVDVVVGAAVQGEIRFDTRRAQAPTYQYTSCTGSCGGGAVAALHRYPAGLTHTVRIGARSWTTYLGNVSLANSNLSRDGLQQSILADDGDTTGRYASLSVYFNAPVGEATLFPDLNVLEELRFDSAIGGSGTIRRGPSDASEGYFVSFAVAPPTATVTPSPESGGGSAVDLIVLGATALAVAPFRLRRRPRRTVMRPPAAIR